MNATWRSRSVATRSTPSASATSWPWAHVSISRAVIDDTTVMSGPYQGTRRRGSDARAASVSARRDRHSHTSASGPATARSASTALSTMPCGLGQVGQLGAEPVGVGDGEAGQVVEAGEVRDLVADRPAGRRRGREPGLGVERLDERHEVGAFGEQVVAQRVEVGSHRWPSSRVGGAHGTRAPGRVRPRRRAGGLVSNRP